MLPESIRVKLSSEDAGALTITPVVAQDLTFGALLDRIVGVTGKDVERILRILRAGELSSGATRYRWAGSEADRGEVIAALTLFPDADPSRPFAPHLASKAVFQEPLGARFELPREAGSKRRFLRRTSFWDSLVQIAASEEARYSEYSYKEKADCYRIRLSHSAAAAIRNNAGMIAYKSVELKLRRATFEAIYVYVPRPLLL